jgi:hypothetical protein
MLQTLRMLQACGSACTCLRGLMRKVSACLSSRSSSSSCMHLLAIHLLMRRQGASAAYTCSYGTHDLFMHPHEQVYAAGASLPPHAAVPPLSA